MPASSKLPAAQVVKAAALVDYQDGSVVSREILNATTGRVSVFAFDEGEGLSEHISPFNALVQVLEGEVEISISGKAHRVGEGELILMPSGEPHALKALERFKMILTLIRPHEPVSKAPLFPRAPESRQPLPSGPTESSS